MSDKSTQREVGKGGTWKKEASGFNRPYTLGGPKLAGLPCINDIIDDCVAAGAYLSFGRSSDGGAILLRVLDGPEKLSSYSSSVEELEEAIEALRKRYPHKGPKQALFPALEPPA